MAMETYPTEMRMAGPCTGCGVQVTSPLPIDLELTDSSEIAKWPEVHVPPFACEACSTVWPLGELPCVYRNDQWAALILDGPLSAIEILTRIANWIIPTDVRISPPRIVRVFDSMMEFSYVLRHPECSLFREDLKGRVTHHWDEEVTTLADIADGALENEIEWLSYVILAGVVQDYPEFFFIPEMRNALEITALASGTDPLPISIENSRSAIDEYQEMVAALEPHRPFPELDAYNIWYDAPLDQKTGQPLDGSGGRVIRKSPATLDLYKVWLRILAAGAFLRHELSRKGQPAAMRLKESLVEQKFLAVWPRLVAYERAEVDAYFRELTGTSLRQSHGLDF